MANLSDFMARVLPYAKGCSYPLAEQHIRDICIDFCTKAPVVQVQLDPISAVTGQADYDLDPPSGTAVTLILEAWYQGCELATFKSGDGVGLVAQPGWPSAYKQSGEAIFSLNFAPQADATDAIRLLVATKPTRKAATVADILINDYSHEIGIGVCSRLLKMPGFDFFNPALAIDFKNEYEVARTEARIRAEASFGRAQTCAKPRRFI